MNNINVILFGIGNVGSALIRQIQKANDEVFKPKNFQINLPVIANSKRAFYSNNGLNNHWETDFQSFSVPYKIEDIIEFVKHQNLENLIAVDATANSEIVNSYATLVENGFHIVAANKIANSESFDFYNLLRTHLKKFNRKFYYSTNVGAGLPVLSALKSLKVSGDEVFKVRGVFSGSLSYMFNEWSKGEYSFSKIVGDARDLGYTEPDPRIDLSGKDVARKLLIIARELGLKMELNDINVQSLVPQKLNGQTVVSHFNQRITELDDFIYNLTQKKSDNQVFRYVAELDVINQKASVALVEIDKFSNLGMLEGTNNIFEIYSKHYNHTPLTIVGSGAGNDVTASGILKDIIYLKDSIFQVYV
jgi:homoserine dehydrogenase